MRITGALILIVLLSGCAASDSRGLVPTPDPQEKLLREQLSQQYIDALYEGWQVTPQMERWAAQYPPMAYDPDAPPEQNLIIAAWRGDLPTARKLLSAHSDVNARWVGEPNRFAEIGGGYPGCAKDFTPLLAMANRSSLPDDVSLADLLLNHGAEVDIDDGHGSAPLLHAVMYRNKALGLWLIEHGAAAHNPGSGYIDITAMSPIFEACQTAPQLAIAMIDYGADPHVRLMGVTPLHVAAYAGQADVVRRLLKAGADPNAIQIASSITQGKYEWPFEEDRTQTPLGCAFRGLIDQHDGIAMTWFSRITMSDEPEQVDTHYLQAIDALVKAGAKPGEATLLSMVTGQLPEAQTDADMFGPAMPPVDAAVVINLTRRLIAMGCPVDVNYDHGAAVLYEEDEKQVPLITRALRACEARGDDGPQLAKEMVTLLLDAGAPVDALDGKRRTPLFAAVESGDGDLVRLLIERGANVSWRDVDGKTPLSEIMVYAGDFANPAEHYRAVKFLIDAGARTERAHVDDWVKHAEWTIENEQIIGTDTTRYDPRLPALLKSAIR